MPGGSLPGWGALLSAVPVAPTRSDPCPRRRMGSSRIDFAQANHFPPSAFPISPLPPPVARVQILLILLLERLRFGLRFEVSKTTILQAKNQDRCRRKGNRCNQVLTDVKVLRLFTLKHNVHQIFTLWQHNTLVQLGCFSVMYVQTA